MAKGITQEDYESLRRENRQLEYRLRKYQQILAIGGESELSGLVDQYISMGNKQLKRIATEINIGDFETNQLQEAIRLIEYLSSVQKELRSFITMHTEGIELSRPILQKLEAVTGELIDMLSDRTRYLTLDDAHLEELHGILLRVREVVADYFMEMGEAS
jgi:hypothetical protein